MQNNNTMQDFVITFLNENLPAHLVYHNHEHTIYVTEKANEIGQHENCTADELRLLNAASLWHDTGFVTIYKGHEEVSCTLAQKHLPQFGFSPFEIELICNMIMATKIPQSPKTKLEEILADADLEYLGTEHARAKAKKLFRELHYLSPHISKENWKHIEISFLQKHRYFTTYCKEKKEPVKLKYLNELLNDTGQ